MVLAAPWPSSPWPGTVFSVLVKIHHLPFYRNFSPDEALLALAIMHNYAPEQYKVGLFKHQIIYDISHLCFSSRILLGYVFHSVLRSEKFKLKKNEKFQMTQL